MANGQEVHRPGAFKQQNKQHKTGQHRSKGKLKTDGKGRVSVKVIGRKKTSLTKQQRRQQMVQLRKLKREEVLTKKRAKGQGSGAPLLTAVVSLGGDVDAKKILKSIQDSDDSLTVRVSELGTVHLSVPRFKLRMSFVETKYGDLYNILDVAKVADSLLLLIGPDGMSEYGQYCLTCLCSQGIPTPNFVLQGSDKLASKKQASVKKTVLKEVSKWFPDEKLHTLDTPQDGLTMLRILAQQKQLLVILKETRPHVLAEEIHFELPTAESNRGILKVSGYVRGQTLSVNSLVHLPGYGDFQLLQIDAPPDPFPLTHDKDGSQSRNKNIDIEMQSTEVKLMERADPLKQESLQAEVVPDPMEGEQTWPTEEELAEAASNAKQVVRRVPKGTSVYQASWIVDSEDEADLDQEDDISEMEFEGGAHSSSEPDDSDGNASDNDEYEELTTEGDDAKYDAAIDLEEEQQMLSKYKEERLHVMFPDEIDTPMNAYARTRFQKYRGLKSFRTTLWDPKENLPLDYARIYQFENFRKTKRRIMKSTEELQGVLPGWYVTLYIANVPKEFMESYTEGKPVVVFSPLQHEQKMTVCNFLLHRYTGNQAPHKSKEKMIFHVGYRRFMARPIYSQHTNGNKHKFEKFLPKEGVFVATVFAPVMFPPASVLMFHEAPNGQHNLLATGSLLSVDPDRIITKRIILSGHPFKINRKMAVVRYMFFNREDIAWFKPVELRTKWGRRGHIKEALGTHGHMKCVFDGQLKSQDTVLMNLYKRVFPKWYFESIVKSPEPNTTDFQYISVDMEDPSDTGCV